MTIIKIAPNDNGSHDNQTINGMTPATFPVPEGWAVVPDDLDTPNFPFGDVEVEEQQYIVEVDGAAPIGIPVRAVTSWTPLPIPETEPEAGQEPSLKEQNARLRAQVGMLQEQQTFLEDCLLEMADVVYA